MSYSAVRPDGTAVSPVIYAAENDRLNFIRKVYGLVFVGLLFFAASVALPLYGLMAEIPVLSQIAALSFQIPWWGALVLIIGSSFLIHSVSMVRGINLIAFFAMAFIWGFLTIPLVAYALGVGGIPIVFQALGLTCIVFGGLSAYVLITRKDFNFLGASLAIGTVLVLGAIVILGVGSMLGMNVKIAHIGLSMVIVVLFSGYVLYDTSKVLHHYATDMVVPAALGLMVDFIILFREILFLLVVSRD